MTKVSDIELWQSEQEQQRHVPLKSAKNNKNKWCVASVDEAANYFYVYGRYKTEQIANQAKIKLPFVNSLTLRVIEIEEFRKLKSKAQREYGNKISDRGKFV